MDAELFSITKSGDLHRLRRLSDANPEFLLQVTPQLNTALHLAARFGHLDVISEIYGRHPSILVQPNAKGDTPLHVAARAGKSRAVELLLNCAKGSANLGGEDGRSEGCGLLGMRNKEKSTALLEAVRRGHRNTAVRLIEAGPELLSAVDDAGESPLYVAAENGMLEVVEHILSASSSSAAHGGPKGRTPLHAAAIKGHLDVTKVLLKNCSKLAKQVDADGRIPLHFAASLGNFDMVFRLLYLDTSTTYLLDKYGRAPIHMAAGNGHTKIVQELIHSCPDCSELLDARGRNILHLAVEKEKLDVVEYILESPHLDDLINERDNDGNSPLHLATINRNLSIVYLLATHECINTSIMNNDGLTAIDIVELDCDPSMRIRKFRILRALKLAGARSGVLADDNGDVTNSSHGEPPSLDSYKTRASTLSLVATLIATVTFAAAFTMPGGYFSDGPHRGKAVLARRTAFKVFLISDTIAMCSSILVTFLLIWAATGDRDLLVHTLRFCMELMWIALQSMAVAFVTGVYLVASKSRWLTIVICVLGCCIPSSVTLILLSHSLPLPLKWRRRNGVALFKLFILDFTSTVAFDDLDGKSSFWSTLTRLLFLRGHS